MEGEKRFDNKTSAENQMIGENYNFIDVNQKIFADQRSAKEKTAMAAVLVVSFLAVILGVTQLAQAVKRPIADLMSLQDASNINAQNDAVANLEQQLKDTDGDGLTDYNELNIYKTSPYLSDSDSDGISDKAEIDAGHDPNCAGSDNCFRTDITQSTGATASTEQPGQLNIQALLSGQSDPQTIRNLLSQQGFPKETLDKISDEQLLLTYRQALTNQNPVDSVSSSQTAQSSGSIDFNQINVKSLTDLKNLTGAQIRQLMIQEGTPMEVLAQVSDEELKNIFLSKLNSASN
ncbi:MAG: hypothetical protein A3B89_03790 [Candidatus Buchananbacteria bacterium RIFCSPHIGHO2_02_FULL_40_13]|uniref:Uncharacterized protein n=1 Tax=Candidatus Buchananbacteria bacterium RIFCSPLOWO2_01_FULL_39_33 TaxID=1797543 RepID=A0A1G1YHL3_9BACT|nr:MAG: hypothetical protein A2820_01295 [Candidatus Buchananbacteria bacterium RIFCSPHIGHO2_01_FULL_40_35]OGY48995.1 MAG: hypothetical protein A3B89_03790 [Candidatus Buchananbacteria bacterium RIFCSPHIGHO2_02_FULL_40_13]OGY51845.1 MAG: hypothetical protein A3A02_03655 [Candidatus Buchananbacteria bacterium RIFCSPLOWO2_01_FULL_39_33]